MAAAVTLEGLRQLRWGHQRSTSPWRVRRQLSGRRHNQHTSHRQPSSRLSGDSPWPIALHWDWQSEGQACPIQWGRMRRAVLIALLVTGLYCQPKAALPDAPGRPLVLRVCTKCHESTTFSGLRMSREEWKFEVDGMIARGAKANRKEARQIVDYLAKNLGASTTEPRRN
jgi:hypothetical protein